MICCAFVLKRCVQWFWALARAEENFQNPWAQQVQILKTKIMGWLRPVYSWKSFVAKCGCFQPWAFGPRKHATRGLGLYSARCTLPFARCASIVSCFACTVSKAWTSCQKRTGNEQCLVLDWSIIYHKGTAFFPVVSHKISRWKGGSLLRWRNTARKYLSRLTPNMCVALQALAFE